MTQPIDENTSEYMTSTYKNNGIQQINTLNETAC